MLTKDVLCRIEAKQKTKIKTIMSKTICTAITGMILIALSSCQKENPPNFVVFIADDISWNDFGCYGNENVQTPNIDRIATEGIQFTNAYLTASSCSPSRISILSGRYPHNTGAAELHTEPKVDLTGFADVLKENGYYCGQAGKWHAGKYLRSGFDTLHDKIIMNGGEGKWLEIVENRPKDKPFFLWLAAIDAHRGWGENEFSSLHDPESVATPPYLVDDEATRKDIAKYYDEIKRFDYYIGEVEKKLKEQGVLENTLIVVMADNGRPFPGCKTRVYDRGMQTPFIVKWPKGIDQKAGSCESMISVIDIAPTFVDLAGIDSMPESFQGKSFSSLLHNPSEPFRTYVFSEHNWHDYEAHERMVRTKDFMYILNSRPQFPNQGPADAVNSPSFAGLLELKKSGEISSVQNKIFEFPRSAEELFDCREDPLQLNNLAYMEEYEAKRKELSEVLITWMEETGDNVPKNLTPDWFTRLTGEKIEEAFGKRGEMPGESKNADEINKSGPF